MDDTNMHHFDGCRIFRANHIRGYCNRIDRRIETWTLNYVHAGALYFAVEEDEPQIVRGPSAFWTWPGPRYRYWPTTEEGWDHYYVSWYGPRAVAWQRSGLHPRGAPELAIRPIRDPTRFRSAFETLLSALKSRSGNDPEVVHRLEGLLLQLHRQRPPVYRESNVPQAVSRIAEAVIADPQRDWDFAGEAEQAGCTPTHFRRVFKAQTGMSPLTCLNKARTDLAAELLRRERLHLQTVASAVGLDDVGYFSRLFHRHQGMAPGTYRDVYHTFE
ncbi:helix-turn-helix transcriptional regulator [Pararhizobium mangrovi]|uniref:AraC family transcriptional regulator n=1 Tax=Pararhizobium mangrovi TaxID=2590452 RepID=A0A506U6X4_9HYPH|nr:AraC family transcriptional regulator [Pararhizobium mangrovi]TPW28369.1 AraC family transcriptional regulator [Pararhizobium mangrovi]